MYAEGTSMSPSVQTPGATLKHLASNLATHHMVNDVMMHCEMYCSTLQ